MSGLALIWAANVKGLKPAAKVVLIQLADFHNKETGDCYPSAKRLADECEMGRATLFRHLATLEKFGLVTRQARGDGEGGRTSNQYDLHLDVTLGPSARLKRLEGRLEKVESQNEMGGKVSKKVGKSRKGETGGVSKWDTNLSIKPESKPLLPNQEEVRGAAEQILAAYPSDRLRNEAACFLKVEEAIQISVASHDLVKAVQAYAEETKGYTRSKVSFSDNWFKAERWRPYVEALKEQQTSDAESEATVLERLASWVRANSGMCRHITGKQAQALLAAGLVSKEDLIAAGVDL